MGEMLPQDLRRASLAEILLNVGIVNQKQLDEGLKLCQGKQENLGQALVTLGFTTEEKMMKAVSIRLGIPYFTTFDGMIEPEAVRAVPEPVARRLLLVPLLRKGDTLTVGMANPLDINAIDELRQLTGLHVLSVMTPLSNIFDSIQFAYSRLASSSIAAAPAPAPTPERELPRIAPAGASDRKPPTLELELPGGPSAPLPQAPASATPPPKAPRPEHERTQPGVPILNEDNSAVELTTAILQQGMGLRASDIHIEPAEKIVRIRFRIDGVLQDGRNVEKSLATSLVARIKILAKLDITETRLPQDGHLRFDYAGRAVDIRVSILPTIHGEKLVLRILDSSKSIKKLTELGLSEPNLKSFTAAIHRPNGIILVTGPTGSGKTTTLYAAVANLNDATRNIVTLEDPVEYHIDRVNQVETFTKIGLTFAAGLRSILRQDPNVILVGEIRDLETAEIAVQAAITGHLVFSTLHTNDAPSTIHRLINMKVEPFLLAAALGGVMAQRLVRRLCDRCKRPHQLTQAEMNALGVALTPGAAYFEAVGCEACFQTGYSGRIAVHEWLNVSRGIRELILKRSSIDDLRELAESEGMSTLQDDAMDKAGQGQTSLAEVIRVTREEHEA
ncbi:MAG: Flp pilus assembly complex ATPase component TadA [Elusimicrobia bacterium]|nr:Flp pilus assembly complex ATPase component TadA [Elusimicrobiota bacterium]